jgi:hypothetical protein
MFKAKVLMVIVSVVLLSSNALTADWEQELQSFVLAVSGPAPQRAIPRPVQRTGRRIVVYHPKVWLDGAPEAFENTVLIRDRTYVQLRSFLDLLRDQYGINLVAEWVDGEVSLTRLPDEPGHGTAYADAYTLFANGLAALWRGDVAEARNCFQLSAKRGQADAADLQAWLEEDGLASKGVIRFSWWNLPAEVRVFVDGQEVLPGTLFLLARTDQEHRLRLETDRGLLFHHTFRVRPGRAYVVTLKGDA